MEITPIDKATGHWGMIEGNINDVLSRHYDHGFGPSHISREFTNAILSLLYSELYLREFEMVAHQDTLEEFYINWPIVSRDLSNGWPKVAGDFIADKNFQ